jgi:UTP-glucose-1-phosphate uridylyltransferase
MDKNAVIFNSEKIKDYKLAEWIAKFTNDQKIKINPKAVQMLADHLGNDLSRIVNELNKLAINKKNDVEITPDDVQQFIGISKDFNIFELQNAISAKDILKANKIIDYFGDNFNGAKITYAIEDEPLGTGGAVLNAMKSVDYDDLFFVLNGDCFQEIDLKRFLDSLLQNNKAEPISLTLRKMPDTFRYGSVEVGPKKIISFTKKRKL